MKASSTMIEVKVDELIGPVLDWAVAEAEGFKAAMFRAQEHEPKRPMALFGSLMLGIGGKDPNYSYSPSSCWHCGGPLIDKYRVWLIGPVEGEPYPTPGWDAEVHGPAGEEDGASTGDSPSALIAACRVIVKYKLGDVVKVPAELAPGVGQAEQQEGEK